ncbi:Mrp family chromosome partitioning ATPase [Methanomicrobium sp. W14]|uniref:Mrp/NBP35 family ATP-binding protein n=1 Tax=Methanomicrobium sp. W14 TaxID=2817839 RepID=UPI001AE4C38D|nr:Mrp/NBP35 family ATP-binding protein [Methanomicrobium sp. W14]MBP2132547.1 Mrp family chromosome partitioning ATPase [Methanomicrobium sp. W14]
MVENKQGSECDGNCSGCASAASCNDPKKANSGLPPKIDMDVKHVILVLSGKGGVGKSTVATNLAMSLANKGYKTGIADVDIHGPNIPKMLGIEDEKLSSMDGKHIEPVMVTGNLSVVSMAFLLPDKTSPVIWRGAMKNTAIRQFLEDVNWGSLDFLVVDLPPGTGDEALSVAQLAPNIAGAVIVTTPQEVAILDSSKSVMFVEKLGIKVLGIIENMSGYVCPHCGEKIDLFGAGGGKKAAKELKVPFLGAIPMDPDLRKSGDEGRPFIVRHDGTEQNKATWEHVEKVMENILEEIKEEDN